MCSCDDLPPSVYREETRVARKVHACCECDEPIVRGDLYVVCSGVWDGRGASFKRCAHCATLAWMAHDLFDDWCAPFGQLVECVSEALREAA